MLGKKLISRGNIFIAIAFIAGILSTILGAVNLNHISRLVWASDQGFVTMHSAEAFMIIAEVIFALMFSFLAAFVFLVEDKYKLSVVSYTMLAKIIVFASVLKYNYSPNPVDSEKWLLIIQRVVMYRGFGLMILLSTVQCIAFIVSCVCYYKLGEPEKIQEKENNIIERPI